MSGTESSFGFTLILSGFEQLSDKIEDAFYEGGCDDALLGIRNRVPYLDFDRVSDSLPNAVLSAITDVHRTGLARVVRVEPGDAVSAAEIARRTNRSRQNIQQLTTGARGPGAFPSPTDGLRSRSPLWSWADVAAWMMVELNDPRITAREVEAARFCHILNYTLSLPAWSKPGVVKRIHQCVQPQHKHGPACETQTWFTLSDLRPT